MQQNAASNGYDTETEPYVAKIFEYRSAIYELEKEQQQLIEYQRNPAARNNPPGYDMRAQFKNIAVKYGEKKREMQAEQDRCEELLAGPAFTSTAQMEFDGESGGPKALIKNKDSLIELNKVLKTLIAVRFSKFQLNYSSMP